MALTLDEAAKLSNDMLLQGVVETIVKDSPVLKQLPFIEIVGNVMTYNQEKTLPTIDFYDVGDEWSESTPTFEQKTASLKIMGGDADVDNFLKATRSNIQDLETAVVELKAKALKDKFEENFIYGDASDYSYGSAHPLFEGRYLTEAGGLNRLQVEGYDPSEAEPIVADAFAWEEIERLYERTGRLEDRNIDSVAGAEARGEAFFRGVEMAAVNGAILIPVNCGQQLYDVIDITDSRAGLSAAKRRVTGLTLVYSPRRGEYRQRLLLGGV